MGIQIVANIDAQQKLLGRVAGLNNLVPLPSFPELVVGDSEVLDLFLTSLEGPLNIQDYPVIRLGIGEINGKPSGGSYTIEGETLAFDHTAAQLQAVITSEVAAATVTELSPFVFVAQFDADGAQTLPTVDATGLTPASTVNVSRLIEGDGSTAERWLIRLYRNPIALTETFNALGENAVRGVFNTGTEGIYELFAGGAEAVTSTIELEVTDTDGAIQTLFQIPVTIRGEVLGEGVPAVVSFDSLVTQSQLQGKFETANTVWVSKSGSDSTGLRGRFDRPFLTVGAAEAAAVSGDAIIVLAGDYSSENLGGKDGVFYDFTEGAIGPGFVVPSDVTISGRGLCRSLDCEGGVIDMPNMNTLQAIRCFDGTQIAGNAGTSIVCEDGTQIAGNAGTFIRCQGGTQTAKNAGTFIECSGGTQNAGNAGTFIDCLGGTQTAGNAGTFINCEAGTQTIRLTDQSHDGSIDQPVVLSGSGNLRLFGNTSESTEENGGVVFGANNWSGNLFIQGLTIKALNAGPDEGTNGINFGTGVTGKVTLKDCTIVTAQQGTGTATSIAASGAQTVYIQGTLNQTHAATGNITFVGGSVITNPNFE